MFSLSEKGLNLIKSFEGFSLVAFPDTGNVWTVGWGHIKNVKEGDKISLAQAEAFLAEDLNWAEYAVNEAVKGYPTTQSQYDAFVSLAFNIGVNAFNRSTALKIHKAGNQFGTVFGILMWYKDNKKPIKGLLIRRLKEALLYLE